MNLLLVAGTAFLALGIAVVASILVVRRLWRVEGPSRKRIRFAILAFGFAIVALPYAALKISEREFVLARVPKPLEVASIEYRLEESQGMPFLGMPGDNETGFVVYRLTEASADWARRWGSELGKALEGREHQWRPTPVDDVAGADVWHPYDDDPSMLPYGRDARHPPTIEEYLDKYGFGIPIAEGMDAEADHAIQSEGSIYRYGGGGSVTIVDPIRGKVYFAYAG